MVGSFGSGAVVVARVLGAVEGFRLQVLALVGPGSYFVTRRHVGGFVVIPPQTALAKARQGLACGGLVMPERTHVRGASKKENRM